MSYRVVQMDTTDFAVSAPDAVAWRGLGPRNWQRFAVIRENGEVYMLPNEHPYVHTDDVSYALKVPINSEELFRLPVPSARLTEFGLRVVSIRPTTDSLKAAVESLKSLMI